jgi:predicted PurR-regulated permease PerM
LLRERGLCYRFDVVDSTPPDLGSRVGKAAPDADPTPLLPLLRGASGRRVLIAASVLVCLIAIIYAVREVVTPVFAALGIAYILAPVVDFMERHKIPRALAVSALIVGLAVLGVGVIALVVPALVAQSSALAARLPTYLSQAMTWIEQSFHVEIPTDSTALITELKKALMELGPSGIGRAGSWAAKIVAGGAGAISRIVSLILIPLFLFFFLKDWRKLNATLDLLPAPDQQPIRAKLAQIDRSLSAYVRGVLTVATILAIYYSIALTALGVPLGLLIGVLAGYAYVVPFMSPIVGLTLSLAFCLLEFTGIGQIAGVLAIFVVGNLIESFLLTPRVVGDSLGLPPMAVILAVMIGANLFGVLGVMLALPTAAVINVIGRDLFALWRSSEMYRTGLAGGEERR